MLERQCVSWEAKRKQRQVKGPAQSDGSKVPVGRGGGCSQDTSTPHVWMLAHGLEAREEMPGSVASLSRPRLSSPRGWLLLPQLSRKSPEQRLSCQSNDHTAVSAASLAERLRTEPRANFLSLSHACCGPPQTLQEDGP